MGEMSKWMVIMWGCIALINGVTTNDLVVRAIYYSFGAIIFAMFFALCYLEEKMSR